MAEKLFILGRPGSGKSTAFRHIKQYISKKYGWSAIHYNDYDILRDMFLFEKLFHFNNKPRQFRATEYDGFDVLDFSVLDKALKELEKKGRSRYSKNEKDELIIIEFARNDYNRALGLFSSEFLKDAYFLFLDTDLRICIKRVQERVTHPTCEDDHFVSEEILHSYYGKQIIQPNFGSNKGKIKVINNKGSFQEFIEKLDQFVASILADELIILDYRNTEMIGANFSTSESVEQIYSKTVQRGAFHFPLFSTKTFTSWFSSTHQKVK